MNRILLTAMLCMATMAGIKAQTHETKYQRPLSDVMRDVGKRFHVKFKYNVDTTGMVLPYADFRIRPYSIEMTLDNICKYFDLNWWENGNNTYRIKAYEYPRRHTTEGKMMLGYLSSLYANKAQWEARRDTLRREVRKRLGIDALMDSMVKGVKPQLSKLRRYDGYTVQNISIETTPGQHVYGSIYSPTTKGKHALIICPGGHFANGRYREDQQQRLSTLARMGAISVDFDLYGWGESEREVGKAAHESSRAHVMQAAYGLKLLDYMLASRKDIDNNRIGVNGGSGGGTHTILLTALDNRITAAAPTVNLASHFDGGCPCESGKSIHLSAGGTCNPELAAMFAPRPLLVVSDDGDWTASVPAMEYPYLQRIYGFYDAKDNVRNVHLPNERHDFGPNKRRAVYDFFIDVFHLNRSMLDESKITIVPKDILQTTKQ